MKLSSAMTSDCISSLLSTVAGAVYILLLHRMYPQMLTHKYDIVNHLMPLNKLVNTQGYCNAYLPLPFLLIH